MLLAFRRLSFLLLAGSGAAGLRLLRSALALLAGATYVLLGKGLGDLIGIFGDGGHPPLDLGHLLVDVEKRLALALCVHRFLEGRRRRKRAPVVLRVDDGAPGKDRVVVGLILRVCPDRLVRVLE